NLSGAFVPLRDAVLGALVAYLFLWIINAAFKALRGMDGMGYGDFKLYAAVGAFLGWKLLPFVILLSSIVGLVFGSLQMFAARRGPAARQEPVRRSLRHLRRRHGPRRDAQPRVLGSRGEAGARKAAASHDPRRGRAAHGCGAGPVRGAGGAAARRIGRLPKARRACPGGRLSGGGAAQARGRAKRPVGARGALDHGAPGVARRAA